MFLSYLQNEKMTLMGEWEGKYTYKIRKYRNSLRTCVPGTLLDTFIVMDKGPQISV